MRIRILLLISLTIFVNNIFAQSTEFTYQGRLVVGTLPAASNHDFEFRLFDVSSGGTALQTLSRPNVPVSNGVFTVNLDYGFAFTGASRYLEIAVKPAGGPSFTTLDPRQSVNRAPYSIQSLTADFAGISGNSQQLGGVAANQFVVTTDPRMTDARAPSAGSPDYIQNRTTQQVLSSFNVSGNGTVGGTLNANVVSATQFNIANVRVFGYEFTNGNTYAGFLGNPALSGTNNSFFGSLAAVGNTGSSNSFFGSFAGGSNNTGSLNSFFGTQAGSMNSSASENSFFGYAAGSSNRTGCCNSFFGRSTGRANIGGQLNAFFGGGAGENNISGSNNTFIGLLAGDANVSGSNNTMIGYDADVLSAGLSFATAIGSGARINRNNQIVLGRSSGQDEVVMPGNAIVSGGLSSNTFASNTITANTGVFTGDLTVNGTLNASLPSNSGNYIQNTTSPQTASFNVSGNGTVGGTLSLDSGTVSAPSLTFSGDSDTGLYRSAPDTLNLIAGGDNRVQIDSGGTSINGFTRGVDVNAGGAVIPFSIKAVFAVATGGGGSGARVGVHGESSIVGFGGASSGIGVRGQANGPATTNYGVYGQALGGLTNWAGYFDGNTYVSGSLGIGSTPAYRLHVVDPLNTGLRVQTNTAGGTVASFGGAGDFEIDSNGSPGGRLRVFENSDVYINYGAPITSTPKFYVNGAIQASAINASGAGSTDSLFEGVRVVTLGIAGATPLCRNSSFQIAACSSSIRYKQNISPFVSGVELISRLRPVTFNWKADNKEDIGLVAEEVAEAEPLLITHNDNGEVEGVKYDRVGVVLINAVKEQQAEIEELKKTVRSQEETISEQKLQIDTIKNALCEMNPAAKLCKP